MAKILNEIMCLIQMFRFDGNSISHKTLKTIPIRTMSMVIFLNVCLCFLLKLTKISHSFVWSNLKATARWWFSNTDSSLYISANSEPEKGKYTSKLSKYLKRKYRFICKFGYSQILLVLMRNWFVSPGWSTSWIAAANNAAITSKGVKTD